MNKQSFSTNKQIKVLAPGKLMLFGEHAVVQGRPCIVTAVDQRLSIKAEKIKVAEFWLEAPDVDVINYSKLLSEVGNGEIPKGAKFVEVALANFLYHTRRHSGKYNAAGIKIQTVSQFKSVFGFGSSSASAVCTIKALSELFKIKLTSKEFFDIAYKTVLDIQGVGSGFDLAAAIYGGTLYYVTGGKVIKPLLISSLPLVVGYTGTKADTATIIREVKARFEKYPKSLKNIYYGIELVVNEAKTVLEKSNLEKVGQLMNINQGYLESLGVSSEKLSAMIYAARSAGAYGAKLSGAGCGDCMIALAPPSKRKAVEKEIEKAGGQVLKVQVNAKGVRIEG